MRMTRVPPRLLGRMRADDRLQKFFDIVLSYARSRCRGLPRMSLKIDCPDIVRRRRRGDLRSFFEVGHLRGKVCTVREAAGLSDDYLVGLMLHELGHVVTGSPEQRDADEAVMRRFGIPILYGGPWTLERVSRASLEKVLRGR